MILMCLSRVDGAQRGDRPLASADADAQSCAWARITHPITSQGAEITGNVNFKVRCVAAGALDRARVGVVDSGGRNFSSKRLLRRAGDPHVSKQGALRASGVIGHLRALMLTPNAVAWLWPHIPQPWRKRILMGAPDSMCVASFESSLRKYRTAPVLVRLIAGGGSDCRARVCCGVPMVHMYLSKVDCAQRVDKPLKSAYSDVERCGLALAACPTTLQDVKIGGNAEFSVRAVATEAWYRARVGVGDGRRRKRLSQGFVAAHRRSRVS